MKTKKVMSRVILSIVLLIALAACNQQTGTSVSDSSNKDEVFTLNLASSIDGGHIQMQGIPIFKEKVESYSDGRLKINYIGGPEAIPGFKQGEAVRSGAIDISWIYGSYYAELVPEVLVANFTELTYEEELKRGSFDYLNELHKDINALILGRTLPFKYKLYLKDEVKSAQDLSGKRIRGTATYVPTLEAFGAEAIAMEAGEIYTSLEKGLINGLAFAELGITSSGLESQIKYEIAPAFNTLDGLVLMNLDKFNRLPKDLQDILKKAAIDTYYETEGATKEFIEKEKEVLKNAGVQVVTLSNAEEFIETAREASWKWLGNKVKDPEKLAEYFRK
ncbi:TRAP transporter substrate-binding protein DctP [Ammoniphilus sp. YIM 78166]|uniref:TRAP transporter substrate-binding protein DctP n=1 Tax=Ammoniphilus sp. YIM 78166 TaxID=1644106 RepID=UPI00106FEF77|nr:TRAP transporter substrate-binding protein DctP [Ammoniphilus sp. YIM 78166]